MEDSERSVKKYKKDAELKVIQNLDEPEPCCSYKDTSLLKLIKKNETKTIEDERKQFYVIDTNILIHSLSVVKYLLDTGPSTVIFIPWIIIKELERLGKKSEVDDVRKRSLEANKYLFEYFHAKDERFRSETLSDVMKIYHKYSVLCFTNKSADDKVLHCCLHLIEKYIMSEIFLVTNDVNLKLKAEINEIVLYDKQSNEEEILKISKKEKISRKKKHSTVAAKIVQIKDTNVEEEEEIESSEVLYTNSVTFESKESFLHIMNAQKSFFESCSDAKDFLQVQNINPNMSEIKSYVSPNTEKNLFLMKPFCYDQKKLYGTVKSRLLECTEYVKKQVKDKNVVIFMSGGMDSAIFIAILCKVLRKDKLYIIQVDNGMLRKNECQEVETLLKQLEISFTVLKLATRFYHSSTIVHESSSRNVTTFHTPLLCLVSDPDVKKKIIEETFNQVATESVLNLKLNSEDTIIGQSYGLATRVLCGNKEFIDKYFAETKQLVEMIISYASCVKKHDILIEWIRNCLSSEDEEILKTLSQCELTSVLLPIKSIRIQGNIKSCSYVVGLSSNKVVDLEKLTKLAKCILLVCFNISRVVYIFGASVIFPVYDITPTYLTPYVMSVIREADFRTNILLHDGGYGSSSFEMAVILVPLHFDRPLNSSVPSCQRSLVIRIVSRVTGETVVPGRDIPLDVILKIISSLSTIPGISRILYDITPQPSGRIEWE